MLNFYYKFEGLLLLADMAFNTSSCSVDGGSDKMSVVVDR